MNQPQRENGSDRFLLLSVDGRKLSINIAELFKQPTPADATWWADQLGRAKFELRLAIAVFHRWRAGYYNGAKKGDSKWQIDAKIEASQDFMLHQEKIANCERNVTILEIIVGELSRKRRVTPRADSDT